ncbi:TonB-dependent receptor [Duganella sp. BJB488]|uniref:TonB-dependent receptor plug domain-containing protein n=1 Tax=unclassified Duganella TaxID=2636909 RepID=UPI000E354D17|nr:MULTISPECIES: TonB-dependent receptor [unclassified Duganella]RFP25799.1 TonB-dependent receptor [Duganella sp. BJB489]RFP28460.1 TonB-dependent receptor [Duganella sp. BJB488]RFP36730.1 TonB-dependent receptor [Duganella sp. BJB480]
MFATTPLRNAVLLSLYGAAALSLAPSAFAQSAPEAKPDTPIQSVSIVGSRRATSSSTDTVVPVDIIPMSKSTEQGGQFDLAQTLTYISPSFNSTRQSGSDGADLVDSAALRGLGSDQTLVLVNGKRRHTTALVNLFGARNRGNTGTDMNTIPLLAIKDVQVLRDGAAAQYGSDAIAGVMDIGLKKSKGCEAVAGFSEYSKRDGKNYLTSAYCGFEIGNGGTLGITGEYLDRGRSNRAEADNPRIIGDSKTKNQTIYLNGELPTVGTGKLYFTAGGQTRDASSAAFARGGVGSDDIPSRNSAAMYPNGFVPFINADIDDRYAILGHRSMVGDWNLDVSQTYGYNKMKYNISHTINASIANKDLLAGGKGISPDHFDAGGFSFQQLTTNLDLNHYYDGLVGDGLNVAFGGEYRSENYKIFAGEPGSYNDVDGVGFGGNAGSQGFPGFQPADQVNAKRHSTAAYLDLEADLNKTVKLQGAVRYEKFSDFGSTVTGKLAGSVRVADSVLLRGSASTGFRAPSLQQVYFSSTFTDFIGGVPTDVVLAPNGGAVANAAGIPKLKEEKSTSFTLGTTWTPNAALSVTADLYDIKIKDRIVLSGRFNADTYPDLAERLAKLGVGEAQFFVNSVDTKTQGLDLTASHKTNFGSNKLTTFLALNVSKTEVTGIHAPASLKGFEDVLLSEKERLYIEQGAPRSKATLGFDYVTGPWESDLKIIHFGPQTLGTFDGTAAGVPNQHYESKTSADLSFTYTINKNMKFTFGGNNIFNVKPTSQNADQTDNGFKYESVQFGLNGASYFGRLYVKF